MCDVVGFILRCRRIADLSQRDLARALGVCHSTVARWETGEREPVASMLARIARLAGLKLALVVPAQATCEPESSQLEVDAPDEGPAPPPDVAGDASVPDPPAHLAEPWPDNTVRDSLGRRLPAHLDAFLTSWDESPSRGRETPGRYLHVPYRPGRRRLRRLVPCYQPGERIQVPGPPVVRRLPEPATSTIHDAWLAEVHRSRQAWREEQRARYRARPDFVETPPCLCEMECHEEIICIPECTCQCEVTSPLPVL